VKAVVKSEVNRDGFLASVFYDEKEINDEKEIDDDLETDLSRAVNDAIARKDPEKYIEKFVVNPVFGECQFCMTEMAESYAIPIQAIKAAFWNLYKKQTFKYLRKYTVEVIDGRVLEFVVFKTKDSIDFDNEQNVIPSESNAVLEESSAAPGETKNSEIESPLSLDEQMQRLEHALEIFIQNFVYGECQLCITDMAQLFNTHTQRIRDVFFELFKKRKIKYNTETINLFDGRNLEFAIVKGKDSLMFNHNTEFKDVIANEINSIAQSGMDEFQKDMKPYFAAKPRVIKFFPADVDYKVDCMVKLTFSKSYK
jgi:hypothetical protein